MKEYCPTFLLWVAVSNLAACLYETQRESTLGQIPCVLKHYQLSRRAEGIEFPSLETMLWYLRSALTCSWLRKHKRVSLHHPGLYRQETCRCKKTVILLQLGTVLCANFIWVKLICLISRHCLVSVFIVWIEIS